MDNNELKEMIRGSKLIFASLKGSKKAIKEEKKTIKFAFASVASTEDIKKGEKFTTDNIFTKRPSNGDFTVKDYNNIIGKYASRNIKRNHQLKKKDIS